MVTKLEAYRHEDQKWIHVGDVPPGQSGSLSQNLPEGRREVYIFECEQDDSKTTLYKAAPGIDIEIGRMRASFNLGEMEVVKEIRRGDEPYRMSIKTDVSPQRRIMRLSHI
jgi:hypothetical protein